MPRGRTKARRRRRLIARKHLVTGEIRNVDLTKTGSSIHLDVYSADEKVGRIEIGRGSLRWWGKNKVNAKRISWPRLAQWLEDA